MFIHIILFFHRFTITYDYEHRKNIVNHAATVTLLCYMNIASHQYFIDPYILHVLGYLYNDLADKNIAAPTFLVYMSRD
jgi:hypothetical protein